MKTKYMIERVAREVSNDLGNMKEYLLLSVASMLTTGISVAPTAVMLASYAMFKAADLNEADRCGTYVENDRFRVSVADVQEEEKTGKAAINYEAFDIRKGERFTLFHALSNTNQKVVAPYTSSVENYNALKNTLECARKSGDLEEYNVCASTREAFQAVCK